MADATSEAFISLFTEAFKKCFGDDLHTTLSETECKHFSNQILEETGLVIGAKSLKIIPPMFSILAKRNPKNLLSPP